MSSIDEKRVYDPDTDPETVYVAGDVGVARVSLVGDRIGELSLVSREPARDVVTIGERVVVATPDDVVELADRDVTELGFGPATALGVDARGRLLAGGEGRLARYERGTNAEDADGPGDGWRTIGAGDIRAIDGDLVASSEGVYRIVGDDLVYSGLDDVSDVSSAARPYAATRDGVYALGNGWLMAVAGDFSVVAGDARSQTTGSDPRERAHAAGTAGMYECAEDGWQRCVFPTEETVVDVAYGTGTHAVTDEGTLFTDAGDGWRGHPVGVRDVRAIAVALATDA